MKKKTIKHLTLIKLLQVFLVAIFTISAVMYFAYNEFFRYTAEHKAIEFAKVVKAGLTSHMKAGIMDKRDYYIKEIRNFPNIKSLAIIRAKPVIDQFGVSKHKNEKSYTDLKNSKNLDTNTFIWDGKNGLFKAIIPYKASSKGELNCLQCHNVKDGETLGALEIEMDISPYESLTSTYGYLLIGLLIFFAFIIILVIFHFIENYMAKPILQIAKEADEAYMHHISINSSAYKVEEIYGLAENLNELNGEVIEKEQQLKEKNRELELLNEEIESTLRETMVAIGEIEEVRSNDVKNHTKRVATLSGIIAKDYGLSEEEIKLIELTSPLHDIGKIGIEDAILLKPDKLSADEYEVMKEHATLGHNILKHSKRLVLQTAAQIAYSHHEKWDGSGYPQGLVAYQIPVFARIVAIVDVLDALLCQRIYKDAWSKERVLSFIKEQNGKHFEPKLADLVEKNFDKYSSIINELVV